MTDQPSLLAVDWSALPAPADDGAASHLAGMPVPDVGLPATDGSTVSLARLAGRSVVYAYPMTGQPGVALPDGWDGLAGARGCTPQSCAFRDHFAEMREAGADAVFGLSTQSTEYQREAAGRLHLPFPLLSDTGLGFSEPLALPTMVVAGMTLLKRLTMIIDAGRIVHVFYPVFPPDKNAGDVLLWLKANSR